MSDPTGLGNFDEEMTSTSNKFKNTLLLGSDKKSINKESSRPKTTRGTSSKIFPKKKQNYIYEFSNQNLLNESQVLAGIDTLNGRRISA